MPLWYVASIVRMCTWAVAILSYFTFRKLKTRRLIFQINCRSNLTIYIKLSGKDKKLIINNVHTCQGKRYFWFEAFMWLVLSHRRRWSWRGKSETKATVKEIWSWETYKFLWNIFQLEVTSCKLQFFYRRYELSKYHENHRISAPSFQVQNSLSKWRNE